MSNGQEVYLHVAKWSNRGCGLNWTSRFEMLINITVTTSCNIREKSMILLMNAMKSQNEVING